MFKKDGYISKHELGKEIRVQTKVDVWVSTVTIIDYALEHMAKDTISKDLIGEAERVRNLLAMAAGIPSTGKNMADASRYEEVNGRLVKTGDSMQ